MTTTEPLTEPLAVGATAPDFTLTDQKGEEVALSSFRGEKAVVVVFFPFAFSGICTGELCEIRDNLEAFASDKVQVLAVSTDPKHALRAFADKEGYFFPILSDFWPHGAVTKSFGVFNEATGSAVRGTFLIDAQGTVVWSQVNGMGEARDFAGYNEAIAAL